MEKMEQIRLENGWEVERTEDSLVLHRHGRQVWEMEIPPKMPRVEWATLAIMLANLYDRAWAEGWETCRRLVATAADQAARC